MFSKLSKILILCFVLRVSNALTQTNSNVAFVIDDTGSMAEEIDGVKQKVELLFKAIFGSKNSKIGDIILVTFNDNEKFDKKIRKFIQYGTIEEAIKMRAKTRDQNTFLRELTKIKVDGGGRCPEPAMAGIKRAVEECNPNSYIYIFTDATAKDFKLADQVIAMAQNKSVQITFLLTGHCAEAITSSQYAVYNKVANTTNGEVFNIIEDDVSKIMNYIIRCIESPTTTVQKTMVKPGSNKITIKVDSDMNNLIISVSVNEKDEVTVSLNDPDGNNVGAKYVFNKPNTKIIEVQNPNSGNYELTINTSSNGVAIVKASIGIDFVHGFNETQVSTIEYTCTRPFAGIKSSLYIALEDNGNKNVRLEKVLIYDMNDKELNSLPVSLINKQTNLYATPLFQPPDETFKITIVAIEKDGIEIIRNSRTPITPQTLPSGFPVIDKQIVKVAAEEGSKTSISCRILKGSPTPTMTWEFRKHDATNFVPLSETKDEIDMGSVESSNAGFYRCHAKNTVGETFHEIELEVQRIPKIDKSNSNVNVKEGEEATISCRIIQGIPKPQIFWEFKGKATSDFVTTSLKEQEIQIYPANLDNAGVYRCRAENVIGDDFHETTLTVQCLPKIDKSESKIAVKQGEKALLSCRIIRGIPKPEIRWEFKRTDASDFFRIVGTDQELVFDSANVDNAGHYKCFAKNEVGEDVHDTELIVQYVPQIDKSKSNINVQEGDTATITCSVIHGIPEPEVFWEFKGNHMSHFAHISEKGQEIHIDPSNLDNAGVYRCSAINLVGNDVHQITLTVQSLPKIDKSESKKTAKKGERTLISCRITKGIPKPDIRWEFKRKDASDFFKISGTDEEFVIESADVDNAGHYRCFAKNEIGEDVHDTELIVQYVPQIDKSKSNIQVKEGDIATIPCRIIRGIPKPDLFWEFKGKDMSNFASIAEKGQEIHIGPSNLDNAGIYQCSAINLVGNDVHQVTLTVQCLPKIDKSETKKTAKKGEKTLISCRITKGIPKPDIRWEFKRKDASDFFKILGTDEELVIESADVDNAGHYRCFAKNEIGEDVHDTELIVQYVPQIDKSKSNIQVKEGDIATIPCRIIRGIPKPDLFWEFKGKDMSNFANITEKGQEIHIGPSNLDNAGVYRCSAINLVGNDVHQITLTVQCLPKIDKSETKKTAKKGERSLISCRITKGIPKPEIRWEFKRKDASDFFKISGTDEELVIDSADVDNAGHYRCFAKNEIGEDAHDTELIVQYVPQIDKSKSNIQVKEGDIATIPCRLHAIAAFYLKYAFGDLGNMKFKIIGTRYFSEIIGGIPIPDLFWEFKGKDMSNFASISEKGQEIHIDPSKLDDAGVYRCSARNPIGNDVHEITLIVKCLPKINKSETKRTANKGERTLISCRITQGIPKPDIRWEFKRKDASDFFSIPGTDQELVIDSADADNAGNYRCFAKNEIGVDDHDTELVIQYVPQIEKSKSNIKVKEGDVATIPCRIISGIPEPEVYWEFKGNYMSDFASITEKGQEIHIDPSNLDNAGVYRCSARNLIGVDVHEITLTVQCLPIIDKSETISTAKKGKKALISCRITQGIPKPDIRWEFKRKDASVFFSIPGTDQEFVIDSADVDNAGQYRCFAKNEIGVDFHDTELFVQYGPEIDKTETIQTVQEGSEAIISCRIVQSFPEAWITWEFKKINTFISIYETGEKLHIKPAELQDSGIYKCTAKNLVGKDVHEIELQVQCLPQIEKSSPSTTVTQKSKAVVPCRIKKGVPEPTITWEFKHIGAKNFVSISGTSQEILINSADLQNAGIYRCHANNPLGGDSHDTELIVQYPPLIWKGKQLKTVVIGAKAALSCRILSAFPDPVITWKFKKKFSSTYIDLAETQQDIYVDTKDVENSGYYKCIAKNNVGEDFHEIELVIEYGPSVEIKQPDDVVKVGDAVILSCNAEGLPEPHVKWLRNNVMITQNHKYNIDKSHNLSFIADLNDRGNYTCDAKNVHGNDAVNATLEVYEPVTIGLAYDNPSLDVGSDLDLVCDARGYPPPKIMWKFTGFLSISPPVVLHSTDKTLTIKRIQVPDSGKYFCIADNQYSQNTLSYTVNVNVPVEIHGIQKEFYFIENDPILRIPCKASGYPEPAIMWEKDSNILKMDNYLYAQDKDGTLVIFNPTGLSEGQYTCNAYQTQRKSKAVKTFIVKRKPIRSPDEKVDTELVEENTAYKPQCKVPHGPTDVIRWYKDAAEITTGVNSELKLYKVSEYDAGIYTCRVNTALGSKSAHIQIVVGAKPVFKHPRKEVVIIIPFVYKQKINLDCDANGKPPPEIKWYHENQLLPVTTFIHTFQEKESHKGTWRCEVKNTFGTVTRTYEIKLTGCVIDYNILDPKRHHPLLVNRKRSLNAFENQDGRLTVPQKEKIQIACPNSQNFWYHCSDNEFINVITSKHYKYTDLKCDDHMKPRASLLSLPGERCALDKNSKLIQVGFQVGSSFSVVYDVCFDSQEKHPKFIYNTLSRFASGVDLDTQRKPQFIMDFFDDSLDYFYEESLCYNQANTYGFGCCFVRKQFVSPRDVAPAVENATYFSVNVMPQWNFCGKDNNWDEVERRIRKLAKTVEFTLKIYSGGFQYETRVIRDVYGVTGYNFNIVVPKYLWKVVQIDEFSQALAIVIINIPNLSDIEAKSLVFCKDVCDFTDWMQNSDWHKVENGYVFCCFATDFADYVDKYYKNIFYTNILRSDQIT